MTNSKVQKADYDIVYKDVVRSRDPSIMDLEAFFDAVEMMAPKLNAHMATSYAQVHSFIDTIKSEFKIKTKINQD